MSGKYAPMILISLIGIYRELLMDKAIEHPLSGWWTVGGVCTAPGIVFY
jgi:hypothetical protein